MMSITLILLNPPLTSIHFKEWEAAMVLSWTILSESVLEPALQVEIIRRSEAFLPGPDGVLFLQGDPPEHLYFLRSGEATLTMHSKGRDVLRVRAVAGSLLASPPWLEMRHTQ